MDLNQFKGEFDIEEHKQDKMLLTLLERSSRLIDNWCGRLFYVINATKNYRIVNGDTRLFIDDLLSITTITVDSTELAAADYELEPLNEDRKTAIHHLSGAFVATELVEIAALWGFSNVKEQIGTLSSEINASVTEMTPSVMPNFSIGQTLWLENEQVFVSDIKTETLTIDRAMNGTTAATHVSTTPIYRQVYPPEVVQACLIQTTRWYRGKDAAWADVVGPIEAEQRYQWEVHHSITFVLNPLRRIHNFGF